MTAAAQRAGGRCHQHQPAHAGSSGAGRQQAAEPTLPVPSEGASRSMLQSGVAGSGGRTLPPLSGLAGCKAQDGVAAWRSSEARACAGGGSGGEQARACRRQHRNPPPPGWGSPGRCQSWWWWWCGWVVVPSLQARSGIGGQRRCARRRRHSHRCRQRADVQTLARRSLGPTSNCGNRPAVAPGCSENSFESVLACPIRGRRHLPRADRARLKRCIGPKMKHKQGPSTRRNPGSLPALRSKLVSHFAQGPPPSPSLTLQ